MSEYIAKPLRDKVREVARHRCEYCQTDQKITGAQMSVDHILPTSKGGETAFKNLCYSCAWCNSFKYNKTDGTDPESGQATVLYNPREQEWRDHFVWSSDGALIIGKTPAGRATVETLKLNNEYIVPARYRWIDVGWHPPTD